MPAHLPNHDDPVSAPDHGERAPDGDGEAGEQNDGDEAVGVLDGATDIADEAGLSSLLQLPPSLPWMVAETPREEHQRPGKRRGCRKDELLAPGEHVDHYVVLEHLGSGGMGAVYKVYDPELNRMVALKLLRGDRTSSVTHKARLVREAQALARLAHPNVVPVYAAGEIGDAVFIIMELVEGHTLEQWLAERPCSVAEIIPIFAAAGRGLYAAHCGGLVHRDVKPRNVLVGKDGRVRILDFGLARTVSESSLDSNAHDRADLAGPAGCGEPPGSPDSIAEHSARTDNLVESSLTRTGLLVGTPRYMAPEQYLHAKVGAEADQFGLCVSLYYAVYGQYPFPGKSLAQLKRNVLSGRMNELPRRRGVPARLRRAILRGLSIDPAGRHASMSALVAELERKGIWTRLRPIAATMLVTLMVVAVLAGSWLLWQRHAASQARERREAVAAARLAALERPLVAADGAEQQSADEDAFLAFVHLDEHRGTRALANAWLGRAERARAQSDMDGEITAYATAYTAAAAPEQKTRALLGLARVFGESWDLAAVKVVLDTLDAGGDSAGGHVHDRDVRLGGQSQRDQILAIRGALALARHDFAGAIALARERTRANDAGQNPGPAAGSAPGATASQELGQDLGPDPGLDPSLIALLGELSQATRTGYRGLTVHPVDVDGDGKTELMLRDDGSRTLRALAADAALSPVWTLPVPGVDGRVGNLWALPLDPGRPPYLLADIKNADRPNEGVIYEITGDGLKERYRWDEPSILSAVAVDIDGDGAREIYVGSGPYSRTLYRLDRDSTGVFRRQIADQTLHSVRSDVSFLVAAELDHDDDRQHELIAVLGPWNAYDVRVLRRGQGPGSLTLVDRRKLGTVGSAWVYAAAGTGEPRIAVAKHDAFANLRVFLPDAVYGEPAGVYIYRLHRTSGQSRLEELDRLSIPLPRGRRASQLGVSHLFDGDFDGDGHRDLVLSMHVDGLDHYTVIYRQSESGSFTPLLLSGIRGLAAANMDPDRADELIVELPGDDQRLWLLGVGSDRLPVAMPAASAQRPLPIPPLVRGDLRRHWERAEELVAMGLVRQAAVLLEELTQLAAGAPGTHHALYRVGVLWQVAGECARAAARYERAAAAGSTLGSAQIIEGLEAAVACYLYESRYADALRVSRRMLTLPELPAHHRSATWSRVLWLEPIVAEREVTRLGFAEPLAREWRILDPLALRRDGRSASLLVESFADHGAIATLPLDKIGERLALSVELEIERSEWAAGVSVLIRAAQGDGDVLIGVAAGASGGGGIYRRDVRCLMPGEPRSHDPLSSQKLARPDQHETVTVTVEQVPELGQSVCTIEREDGQVLRRREPLVRVMPRGRYELVIGSNLGVDVTEALVHRARIRSITVSGARLITDSRPSRPVGDDQAEPSLARGHRLLSEGDAHGALAAYDAAGAGYPLNPGSDDDVLGLVGRAIALDNLGRSREAVAALRRLAAPAGRARLAPGPLSRALTHLVRSREGPSSALVREALGPAYVSYSIAAWLTASLMHQADPLITQALVSELGGLHELRAAELGAQGPLDKMLLLLMRGQAWLHRGNYAAARADLDAAVSLAPAAAAVGGTGPVTEAGGVGDMVETAYRWLAVIEAGAGNRERALAHVAACLEHASTRELTRDRLLLHPEIRALSADPRWAAIMDD